MASCKPFVLFHFCSSIRGSANEGQNKTLTVENASWKCCFCVISGFEDRLQWRVSPRVSNEWQRWRNGCHRPHLRRELREGPGETQQGDAGTDSVDSFPIQISHQMWWTIQDKKKEKEKKRVCLCRLQFSVWFGLMCFVSWLSGFHLRFRKKNQWQNNQSMR